MVMTHGGRQGRYASCGYHPEYNSFCIMARKSYGECCGPCESPCYIVACMHDSYGQAESKVRKDD